MEKILRALNEGKTTMQYKGKKNVPISKVVEDFNKTSKNFAKKNNIRDLNYTTLLKIGGFFAFLHILLGIGYLAILIFIFF